MDDPVELGSAQPDELEVGLARQAGAVARFNRFYARQIGILTESLLQSAFSLTEVRVLSELSHRGNASATELAGGLGLDAGYLSRIVRSFEERDLIVRTASEADGRRATIALTEAGHEAFGKLDRRSHEDIRSLLVRL